MTDVNKFADRSTAAALAVEREALEAGILLIAPVVPHICHSLWIALGHSSNVIDEIWPNVDQAALVKATITLIVQVNGKVRAKLEAPNNAPKDKLEAIALNNEQVKQFIGDKIIRKVIVVPNKLVNIVAN